MILLKDPSALTPEERLAEVAAILARGWSRSHLRTTATAQEGDAETANGERNQLASLGYVEPLCSDVVNSRENEEVA